MAINYPIPDLDEYVAIPVPKYSGCEGCIFRGQLVKCSAIPCIPRMDRPYPVIYKPKT